MVQSCLSMDDICMLFCKEWSYGPELYVFKPTNCITLVWPLRGLVSAQNLTVQKLEIYW